VRADLPSSLPLICPACRARSERGHELHTLSVEKVLRARGDEIDEGILRCDNGGCHRRYPILDGIPLIVPQLERYLASELPLVIEGDLSPEVAALLALSGPDDAPYTRLLEHLSIYLDAHWGDRAQPPPDLPAGAPAFGMQSLVEHLRAAPTAAPTGRAVELGCSVGRGLAELARSSSLVVGIDLHFGALRRARRLLAGEPLRYGRRVSGRHYAPVATSAGELATDRVALICADALDPPLVPNAFSRVAALNLVDSVSSPTRLLSVLDGLCAPAGELLLASPYAWQSGIVADEHRPDTDDPAAWFARRLTEGTDLEAPYSLVDEAELTWWLRRDARSGHAYAVHWLRARKSG